jgi:hypothetical protein
MAFIASGPIKILQVQLKCLLLPVVSLFSARDTWFLGEWLIFMTTSDLLISEKEWDETLAEQLKKRISAS